MNGIVPPWLSKTSETVSRLGAAIREKAATTTSWLKQFSRANLRTESRVSAQRAAQALQMRTDPLAYLTPELLAQYHANFKAGFLRDAALMWEGMIRNDDQIAPVVANRLKTVPRYGYEFVLSNGAESNPRAMQHKQALKEFYSAAACSNALDRNERGGVPLLLRQMLSALGFRYAVHEIVWKPAANGLSAEFVFVPLWLFWKTGGSLQFAPNVGAQSGEELNPGEWLVTTGDGLMFATAACYVYKHLPLRDWLIYCNKFGVPGLYGVTTAAQGSPEWDALQEALENFGADLALLTNQGAQIKTIEAGTRGQLPHPALIDRMDRAIARIWRGGDLSTMSGTGSNATGASVQGREMDVLEQDDAALLTDTLNEQVDRFVIQYRFGEEPLAWIRIRTAARADVDADIAIDTFLAESGFPLSAEALAQRYNRPLPDPKEHVLKPSEVAAPPVAIAANTSPVELDPTCRVFTGPVLGLGGTDHV